jgi:hypothetical protein
VEWRSPNYTNVYATIMLPQHTDAKMEEKELGLSVWECNSDQSPIRKTDLAGIEARIGSTIVQFNEASLAIFRLRDLRTSRDSLLWVGSDTQPWELVVK